MSDQTKEIEIGGVCSTHGRSEMQAGRWSENMEEMKYFACRTSNGE